MKKTKPFQIIQNIHFYWLIVIVNTLLMGCDPVIKNNQETLDEVFGKTKVEIEIQNYSSSGGQRNIFYLEKGKEQYRLTSKRTQKSKFIPVDDIKFLKMFLSTRIGTPIKGECTTSEYVRIGSFLKSVDYEHRFCEGLEAETLDELLGYRALLEKPRSRLLDEPSVARPRY